jgi:hypothetical protein
MIRLTLITIAVLTLITLNAEAKPRPAAKLKSTKHAKKAAPAARTQQPRKVAAHMTPTRAPAAAFLSNSSGVKEVDKPLQVTGQSRNLSMMLTLKNEKDKVKFVEVRRSYRDQVPFTRF